MRTVRSSLRQCLCIALLAAFGIAIGPTVSRMLLPSQEHCGAMALGHDMATMSYTASPTPALPKSGDNPASSSMDHCGLCVIAALACVALPASPVFEHAALSQAASGTVAATSPGERDEWSAATWHGPPPAA